MANYWWMVLTILSLNANGLHTETKWNSFWSELPKSDILCIQEMHLTSQQEFAFTKYAQSYDNFFSHDISNSASVFVAVCRSCDVIVQVRFLDIFWSLTLLVLQLVGFSI